jgi:2-polyprenyl-6-methoxyphenol hydroxylase-like FAD-dependent oxidoreductase
MPEEQIITDVLVTGAGPVGMTLALDLARRGVKTIIIDSKKSLLRLPKMERSNPRSMEIYSRLGIIDRLRAAGYPADVAMDCFITPSLAEPPLVHLRYPSVNEARRAIAACTDGSLPREPYQLISQYTLEPILLDELSKFPTVEVKFDNLLLSFTQDENGVTAKIRLADGTESVIRAKFLAGCDGGSSTVRKQLGIALEGKGGLAKVNQVFFRSDNFYEKCTIGAGRHYSFVGRGHGGAGVGGVIIVQDDRRHFTLQTTSPQDTDFVEEIRQVTGIPINAEILYIGEWTQHMLVAERYHEGRVFLAGDANHLYIPAGGLGLNTGIGDANDLGWMLAAQLQGWGGPKLRESYTLERQHVGRRNLAAVWHAVEGVVEWRGKATEIMLENTPEGRAARESFVAIAEPLNRRVYEMHGTELGYRYTSPIIATEESAPPADHSLHYQPGTYPGQRLPHVWLPDGSALHDHLGKGFTLLKLGNTQADTRALEESLHALHVPCETLEVPTLAIRDVYERDLLLVRPDLHIAWRGNEAPAEPRKLARMVTGWEN